MIDNRGTFSGKVGLQQRVLPAYRVPFVDRLAAACGQGLEVFAGQPKAREAILTGKQPENGRWVQADNRHWLSGSFYLLRQPGIIDWLERWQPRLLILEANPRYLDNWRAADWAHQQGVPVIGWGLGAPAVKQNLNPLGWVWRRFLTRFDAMVAYSSQGAQEYRAAGVSQGQVFVAINATVAAVPEPLERQAAVDRPHRLLFVGRLQSRKRVDRLLKACARLGRERVQLRVVGDGPDRARLERLAAEEFPAADFTGSQRGEALEQSFRWADLFVLPGTGGLAVQQAMAHGLPVVVSEGDGTQADLVRPENGWLVADNTVKGLAETLAAALASPEKLMSMGRASADIVRKEVNLEAMVATFIQAMRAAGRERS